MTQPTI